LEVLQRTVDSAQEFPATDLAVSLRCYPLETVARVELRGADHEAWRLRENLAWQVRSGCVVAFAGAPGRPGEMARVIYTGGCILPGAEGAPGQFPLPADLLNAATEKVACWFLNRDRLGVVRQWPKGGTYEQYSELDLLPGVEAVLRHHTRL
jgi:hypothetical protein